MGGGKEKKKTNQQIQENRDVATGEHTGFTEDLSNRIEQSNQGLAESSAEYKGAIGSLAGRDYSVDPNAYNIDFEKYRIDPEKYRSKYDFGEAREGYRGFAKTGGIDEERMRLAHGTFKDIMDNQDIANRFRGGGVYEDFAKTGGVSAQEAANLRARGTSVIPAYYSRMNQEADRTRSLQGGYGPGAGALKSRLARDAAAGAQSAALNTELGIADRIREGKMFGAQGMTGAEGAYQGARHGAAGALTQSEAGIQNALQQGRMFGTGGIMGVSSAEAELDRANMDRLAGLDVGNMNRLSGLEVGNLDRASGLAVGNMNRMLGRDTTAAGMYGNIYQGALGRESSLMGAGIGERGLTYNAWNQGIDQRMQNNPQRDYLGMALGAAGPIISGIAGMPRFPSNTGVVGPRR